jgi:hypothetical protein
LCCLSFFDIRILITPLVSSNSSSLSIFYHLILFPDINFPMVVVITMTDTVTEREKTTIVIHHLLTISENTYDTTTAIQHICNETRKYEN